MNRLLGLFLLLWILPETGWAQPSAPTARDASEASEAADEEPAEAESDDGFQVMNLRLLREVSGRPREVWEGLEPYRRTSDGTLNWRRIRQDWKGVTARGAASEAGGFLHFGLALFLKELAVVAETGDRGRISEFFDGLLTTDFYKQYGLFVAGARLGEVAYAGLLQRYIKPGFVSGLLKTNMVLALGLALPQVVEGRFEGRAFAISVGSLGLSSAAIELASRGVKGLMSLKKARSGGKFAALSARLSARFGPAVKVGGWVFTAAKLAVVLYFAEEGERLVNEWLGVRDARKELADATAAFAEALGDPDATPESIEDASRAYHDVWSRYRGFLFRRLFAEEARFAKRVEDLARDAKITTDTREGLLSRLPFSGPLAERVRAAGSVEDYADRLLGPGEAALKEAIGEALTAYEANRRALFREVYEENRRGSPLLAGIGEGWLDEDGARGDVLDALGSASTNRLESYDDERAVIEAARAALEGQGRGDLSRALDPVKTLLTLTRDADERLYTGEGPALERRPRRAIVDRSLGD